MPRDQCLWGMLPVVTWALSSDFIEFSLGGSVLQCPK